MEVIFIIPMLKLINTKILRKSQMKEKYKLINIKQGQQK